MDEPIEVDVRFLTDGALRPQAFRWRSRRYEIASLGRQWEEEGERRFLVMTPDERVFELAYLPAEGAWRLRRSPQSFSHPGDAV